VRFAAQRGSDRNRTGPATARGAKVARRTQAIARLRAGENRKAAAKACGINRKTRRGFVRRYYWQGLAGLGGPDPVEGGLVCLCSVIDDNVDPIAIGLARHALN